MKFIFAAILFAASLPASAQYYYRDILGTRESSDMMKIYLRNKVKTVLLTSYDADNTKSDNFFVMQEFNPATGELKTTTKTGDAESNILYSWVDSKGNVVRTLDSSETYSSTTTYSYNDEGQLTALSSRSNDSSGKNPMTEEHIWKYANGQPQSMLRIRNQTDTSYITLVTDDRGNIVEERYARKGVNSEPVYYYYDRNNRLTDIVRFSAKANRLLPEYMFEYSPSNQVIQKITVPANSDKYLIWRYQYNEQGLKIREAIYDKQKDLTGKVEYLYSFDN